MNTMNAAVRFYMGEAEAEIERINAIDRVNREVFEVCAKALFGKDYSAALSAVRDMVRLCWSDTRRKRTMEARTPDGFYVEDLSVFAGLVHDAVCLGFVSKRGKVRARLLAKALEAK